MDRHGYHHRGILVFNTRKLGGYAFGILGTATLALVSILSKIAYRTTSRDTFLVLMYAAGVTIALLYIIATKQTKKLVLPREQWLSVGLVGLFYFVGATALFVGIEITDPSLVSFFGRMQTVYAVIWSVVLLKERLNRGEVVGMVLTMAGALIITWSSGQQVLLAFLIALLGESLFNSLGFVSSKIAVQRGVPNAALVFYRSLVVLVLTMIMAVVRGQLMVPSREGIGLGLVAGLIGPFLTWLLINRALQLAEASKVAIIRNIQPIFVVLLSLMILRTVPQTHQLLGGAVSLAGVVVILRAQVQTQPPAAQKRPSPLPPDRLPHGSPAAD
jgi:drug/metabolite transporter (DMT)-like permease